MPASLPQQGIYSYFRGYLATCPWVKHDVNPRQNQRLLIRNLRRDLRDFLIQRVGVSANYVRAATVIWLRENAGQQKLFLWPVPDLILLTPLSAQQCPFVFLSPVGQKTYFALPVAITAGQ
ncbi:MAG: hypothetical protein ACLP5H_12510 [Desulfomonilaceae bacterium]